MTDPISYDVKVHELLCRMPKAAAPGRQVRDIAPRVHTALQSFTFAQVCVFVL